MNLFDLPLDVFLSILEQTVVTVSYRELARLRLVCKLFNAEIPRAICGTRLLELRTYPDVGIELTSLYLYQRTIADGPFSKGNFQAVIYEAVDTILQEEDIRPSENLRREYLQTLCRGAASWRIRFDQLQPGSTTRYIGYPGGSKTDSLFVATACLGKTALIARLLLERSAFLVSIPNVYLGPALRCAVAQGHYDTARTLLDAGADDNYSGLVRDSALAAAAFEGHRHIVELLLETRYNCTTFGELYEKAICHAARGGHLEIVLFMIQRGKFDDLKDLTETILSEAAECGQENVVQWALDNGAEDHDDIQSLFRRGALDRAALNGQESIVRLLLRRSPYDFSDAFLQTMVGGSERTARTILNAMMQPNPYRTWCPTLQGPFGETCLTFAARHNQTHMIHFLMEKGAGLTQTGGEMAMYHAALKGHVSAVRALVAYGAALNSPDPSLDPLGQARAAGHHDLVKLLVELGAK